MAYAQSLRTQTVYNAIKHAKRLGDIVRFRFPESVYRHYDRLENFPRGVLPLGDAICRFDPVYGQGMSVAAQQARVLARLLEAKAHDADPLAGLAPAFFAEVSTSVVTPWAGAAIPDFVHPDTRGERPPNFEQALKFGVALTKLAARDPAVHKLTAEVQHLLKPRSVYQDPELVQRVLAVMAPNDDRIPCADQGRVRLTNWSWPGAAPNRFPTQGARVEILGVPVGRRGSSQALIVPWSEQAPSFLCEGHSVRWTRQSNAHLIGHHAGRLPEARNLGNDLIGSFGSFDVGGVSFRT